MVRAMRRVKISEVFDLQMGKTPSRNKPEYWNNGEYDWVSIRDLGGFGKYVGKTAETISGLGVTESGIKAVPARTLIMSFKLSLGKTAITTQPTYTNEAIMAFIDKGTYPINLDYFYHQFSGRDWSAGTNKAVMGATLNKKTLADMVVAVPDAEEQAKVAAVLDGVELEIDLQQRRLAAYDQLVKSRFVEMFGDLRGNKHCFPIETMEKVAIGIYDGEHGKVERAKDGPLFLSARNIGGGVLDYETAAHVTQAEYERISKRFNPMLGDVVLTCAGTIGRAAIVGDVPFVSDRDVALIKPDRDKVLSEYLLAFFKSDDALEQMGQLTHAATIAHLYLGKIKSMRLLIPPIVKQREFASFVQQVDKSRVI